MTKGQFSRHYCEPEYKQTRTILATEIIDLTCKDGKKVFLATGYDGIDYMIKVQKPSPISLIKTASDEISQRKPSDEDFTEPPNDIHSFLSSYS